MQSIYGTRYAILNATRVLHNTLIELSLSRWWFIILVVFNAFKDVFIATTGIRWSSKTNRVSPSSLVISNKTKWMGRILHCINIEEVCIPWYYSCEKLASPPWSYPQLYRRVERLASDSCPIIILFGCSPFRLLVRLRARKVSVSSI